MSPPVTTGRAPGGRPATGVGTDGRDVRVLVVTNMYPQVSTSGRGTFIERQVQSLRDLGVDSRVLVVRRSEQGMMSYVVLGRRVRQAVLEHNPDIIHVMYGGVMAAIVTWATPRRPVIVSFCGTDLLGQASAPAPRRVLSALGVLASRSASRRADGIVVKSRNLLDALPSRIDRAGVAVIPNGVDLDRFRPLDTNACRSRLEWHSDRFHVLFADLGDPTKRPELARQAVTELGAKGVPAELHRLDGVPHAEVATWMNAADVLLLTSTHEGSPNIVKEALACNLPVVSVDVGDVRDRVRDVPGCHVTDDSHASLADGLFRVSVVRGRVNGRAHVADLSLQRVAVRVYEFYLDVLARTDAAHERRAPTRRHLRRVARHA